MEASRKSAIKRCRRVLAGGRTARKLVLTSLVLIGAGVALLSISNPLLRSAFSGVTQNFGGQTTSGGGSAGTFSAAAAAARASATTTSIIESLLGFGLAGVGLVLECLSMFTNPKIAQVTTRGGEGLAS